MNSLEERINFFCQLGLTKKEAYDWAKQSLQNASFNLDYFKSRREALRQSSINMDLLYEIKIALGKDIGNNVFSRHRNHSASPLPPSPPPPPPSMGNFSQYLNELGNQRRSRSRSPLNYTNLGNSQQTQSNFSTFARNGSNQNHNNNNMQMGNSPNQCSQFESFKNYLNTWQSSLSNISLTPNFDELVQQMQGDNVHFHNVNNQNSQNIGSQLSGGFEPMSTRFHQNTDQNNAQQTQSFNLNNRQQSQQLPSNSGQQFQQFDSNPAQSWTRREIPDSNNCSNQFSLNESMFSRRPEQNFQAPQNGNLGQNMVSFPQNLGQLPNPFRANFLKNPFHKESHEKPTPIPKPSKLNVLQPTASESSGKLPGVKCAKRKKKKSIDKKKSQLKDLSKIDLLKKDNETLVSQVTFNAPKTPTVPKIGFVTLRKREIVMPTKKNWASWFKSNSFVEKKIMPVDDKDPQITKAFSVSDRAPKAVLKLMFDCYTSIAKLLTNARKTGKYQDAYNFLTNRLKLQALLVQNLQGISLSDINACNNLLQQIDIIDMISQYKNLIGFWRISYGRNSDDKTTHKQALPKYVDEKVLNWLVGLAFKELKRISNPVLNPKNKLDQLIELHEFCRQNSDKKKCHSIVAGKAWDFVRSTVNQLTECLTKADEITKYSSKIFAVLSMHLMSQDLDKKISAELKKEKYDLLDKLKTSSYAKQNYEYLIDEMLVSREKLSNLKEADPRLITSCEKKMREQLRNWIYATKKVTNFLLNQRLAKNGQIEEKSANNDDIQLHTTELEIEDEETFQPIQIPRTKEEQYKQLHEISSVYDQNEIQNFFYRDLNRVGTEDFQQIVKYLKKYLETRASIRTGSCKRFVIAKIRLADKSWDEILSEDLKKEKYALLDELKRDTYAKMNCNFLIENELIRRMRYFHLRKMDKNLLNDREKEEILVYKKLSKNDILKFMLKHLLDERLAETGTYLTDEENNVLVTGETLNQNDDLDDPKERILGKTIKSEQKAENEAIQENTCFGGVEYVQIKSEIENNGQEDNNN